MANNSVSTAPIIGNGPLEQKAIPRTKAQLEPVREIVFWEEQNPKSLVNLVSDRLRDLMRQLPQSLLAMSDRELQKKLDPTWIQDQLRLAFWDEYFLTIDNNCKKMRMEACFAQVCSKETFYTQIENPLVLTYITRPPQGYILKMRSLLDMALERFREVLKMEIKDADGKVNTKLISEIVKIATLVDNRVKGAVTQKIQIDGTQKNLNVNVNQTYEPPKTHQDMEKELQAIENEIRNLKAPMTGPQLFESDTDDGYNDEPIEVSAISVETKRTR